MRHKFFSLLLLFILFSTLSASANQELLNDMFKDDKDDFAEFGDLEAEKKSAFSEFESEKSTEMQAFRDERDRDFAEFLKAKWEAFTESKGLVKDPKPKPKVIPKAIEDPIDKVAPKGEIIKPPPPPRKEVPPPHKEPIPAPVKKPTPAPIKEPVPVPVKKPTPAPVKEPVPEPVKEPTPAPVKKPLPVPEKKPVPAPDKKPVAEPKKVPVPIQPEPTPVPRPEPKPKTTPSGHRADVLFYGKPLRVYYDPVMATPFKGKINNKNIATYWATISRAKYEGLVNQLGQFRRSLELNDWGYYQLVSSISETIHKDLNSSNLLTWFTMTKSGYRVRIGYSGRQIFLFAPSREVIYQIPYLTIDGRKFYNLTYLKQRRKSKNFYTYKKDYPNAEHLLGLDLQTAPKTGLEKQVKQLRFRYRGRTHDVPVNINWHTVRFYNSYPQTEWPVYIMAPTSLETESSLVNAFRDLVKGKSETVAVNMLLRFVQTAFDYQTDKEQFGREKYMFAEETLFSKYSDCEDRSFLFIYLVRRILGMEAVALHYPGHMAAAVGFSERVKGDSISVDGRRFVVCDPTYVNANIGTTMPQFRKVKPKVIRMQ